MQDSKFYWQILENYTDTQELIFFWIMGKYTIMMDWMKSVLDLRLPCAQMEKEMKPVFTAICTVWYFAGYSTNSYVSILGMFNIFSKPHLHQCFHTLLILT